MFRPDGENLRGLIGDLPYGEDLFERLRNVFQLAGDGRRPTGGRDAYFIVRSPRTMPVEQAEHHGTQWIKGLGDLAKAAGRREVAEQLASAPKLRILEGIPPKHPKLPQERSQLLDVIQKDCAQFTSELQDIDPHAELLRPAYYYMACDAMLRDYLMWPFYAAQTGLADPLRSYFALWSHGVKFRIFREDQIDLYLPRDAAG